MFISAESTFMVRARVFILIANTGQNRASIYYEVYTSLYILQKFYTKNEQKVS